MEEQFHVVIVKMSVSNVSIFNSCVETLFYQSWFDQFVVGSELTCYNILTTVKLRTCQGNALEETEQLNM